MKNQLIVMVRDPIKPHVKIHVDKGLGSKVFHGMHSRLLHDTLLTLLLERSGDSQITLALGADHEIPTYTETFPELNIISQSAGNIGTRMWQALRNAFEGGAQKAILIDSDIPGIHWDIIQQAFDLIDEETIAVGPTRDRRYYLIGMQSPGKNIFQDILWNTNSVLAETISNITQFGVLPSFLPTRFDLIFRDNLHKWQDQSNDKNTRGQAI